MRINWLVLHCSACLQIVVCVILVERTLPFLYSKSNSCELSLSPIYQFSDRTKFKDPHVLWTHKPIRILRDVRCRGLMVTEALQFGWQVRDGFQRQRRSKEGYFGGRLQGPSLMKAANIWLLDWINEFFSIAQEAFFFGGGVFFFLLAPKLLLKEKKHCQNGSLLVDYTLEEIRGKADIKKLNCNIGAEGAVILFLLGGILDPSKTLVETLVKLVICWFANRPSLSMNWHKNSPRGMDLLAEAFRQREVDDAAAMACHVTISPLGLP